MIRETFPVGLLGCNCTILGDEISREAIVVDPGYDIPQILAAARRTSAHRSPDSDHSRAHRPHCRCAGAEAHHRRAHHLQQSRSAPARHHGRASQSGSVSQLPEVRPARPFSCRQRDHLYPRPRRQRDLTRPVTPKAASAFMCLTTNLLLAGDTLFAGGVGRTDFPGGNQDTLFASIRDRLLPLPDRDSCRSRSWRRDHTRCGARYQSVRSFISAVTIAPNPAEAWLSPSRQISVASAGSARLCPPASHRTLPAARSHRAPALQKQNFLPFTSLGTRSTTVHPALHRKHLVRNFRADCSSSTARFDLHPFANLSLNSVARSRANAAAPAAPGHSSRETCLR